jgi:gamma-glutamyltranspeptidase/glutathione hydrolase
VADPRFNPAPLAGLLSKPYAGERRKVIDHSQATLDTRRGSPVASSDTVYLAAVDGQGNACSFINSNYMGFGTGIVPQGTGFSLQNRGYCFSLDPDHPNALAPRKRPYHTIIPAMATRDEQGSDGALYASFGVMGGFMQPQGHVQVIVGLVDDGLDPQSALDRPRFCLTDARPASAVELEDGITAPVMSTLARMGHAVIPVRGYGRAALGRGQIILRDPETGVLCGASDPRADGQAVGW